MINEVITEIVYVLEKFYKFDKNKICNELKNLIESAFNKKLLNAIKER